MSHSGHGGWFSTWLSLWLLRRPAAPPPGGGVRPAVGLGLFAFMLWIGIDWWQSQPDPTLTSAGIPLFAWHVLAVIMIGALLCWRSRPSPAFADALALMVGLVPVLLIAVSAVAMFLAPRWLDYARLLLGVYALIYLARGLEVLVGRPQRLTAALAALATMGFLWASDALNAIPDVWTPAATAADDSAPDASGTDASDTDASGPDAEAILFDQPARIDRALADLHRGTGAAAEGFFLGFAGDGSQKEFAQEIGLAARVLGERYHLEGRHLALLNDERDLDSAPLATVSGLRYALKGIAARMRLDRDVLFLAVSSHGSRDATIAVDNSQLPLDALSAEDLAQALQDAGIEWRVIIVSACYAGSFIPVLRDSKTIVIAAAAADRTSFGCSPDRDLTYFGEAFYRDALPDASSLRDAFGKAAAAIAAREKREGIEASRPEADYGAALERKLESGLAPGMPQGDAAE
jgi:hypothetical protein